jgi:hypothetical protein
VSPGSFGAVPATLHYAAKRHHWAKQDLQEYLWYLYGYKERWNLKLEETAA